MILDQAHVSPSTISRDAFSISLRNTISDDATQLDSAGKRVSYFGLDLMFVCFSLILFLLIYAAPGEYWIILLNRMRFRVNPFLGTTTSTFR